MKEIPLLHEDSFCMIFNKPSGLPVQGGEGVKFSLDSWLSENFSPRPFLVHRLDKDTSGLILVAKTREAARYYSGLFAGKNGGKNKTAKKYYLGVCSGIPEAQSGVISSGLKTPGKGKMKTEKDAETRYRLLTSGSTGFVPCSLLELELKTGRTHQIRRHLLRFGHPILGDDKYGDFLLNKKLKKAFVLKHMLLHASRLILPSFSVPPLELDLKAPLPEYFLSFLEAANIPFNISP